MKISTIIPSAEVVAVLAGISVPFLVFGRVVMAVPLILAALVLVWLPGRQRYWRALRDQAGTPIGMMVLVTLALWLPSMFASPLPLRSLEAWIRVPIFVGFIVFLAAMLSERRETLALALKALMVAGAVASVFALSSLTFLPEVLAVVRGSGWSATPYPGFSPDTILKPYAALSVLMAPVLVWAGWRINGRWRMVAAMTVVGLLIVVWLTYNRAAMAGLLAIAVVGAGLTMVRRRNLAVNVAVSAVVAMAILAMVLWLYETRGNILPPEGTVAVLPPWLLDYQRQTIWAHAIDIGMRAPWFGNGINVINLLPGADMRMPANDLNVIPAHPHNWLVEVFAETGAIGALALLTLVLTLCLKLARDFLRSDDAALLAALLVNVGYWGSGLVGFSFWSAWWQVSYLLMTALCLTGWKQRNGD